MNAVDIILKKRNGAELTNTEIGYFIDGFVQGTIPDYQAAAWAMAIYFSGMTNVETTALTLAMAQSGTQLDLHKNVALANHIIVDKHSSGGVGDKTTLVVAPIVAACGLPVGKMSGRGLSFTGGTIDKLEAIPGWCADRSEAEFQHQLQKIGLVIAGQTADLAPADKLLYALRDVTGTVDCLPLIASSIMSKKLASGADAIVLDVKCGHGAFMPTPEAARPLAELMVHIGTQAGRDMTALITQMDQPLGQAVGNTVELQEAVDTLRGQGPADFQTLVETLASEMLQLGQRKLIARYPDGTGLPDELFWLWSLDDALLTVQQVIQDGTALAKFRTFVAVQGGDLSYIDAPETLPQAPIRQPVYAPNSGYVQQLDARTIGLTVLEMGGGRRQKGDDIDHHVGIVCHAKVGDQVTEEKSLFTIHAADQPQADAASLRLQDAYQLQTEVVEPLPIIHERITGKAQ